MANETELQRMRRLLEMSEGPLEKIRRQQALTDRLFGRRSLNISNHSIADPPSSKRLNPFLPALPCRNNWKL